MLRRDLIETLNHHLQCIKEAVQATLLTAVPLWNSQHQDRQEEREMTTVTNSACQLHNGDKQETSMQRNTEVERFCTRAHTV